MKFKDLPKFTRVGHYNVNVNWKYFTDAIERYVKEYKLEMNPDFQRGNVWTEKQQIAFAEYMLKGGTQARTIYFNHPGWMTSFEGPMYLVDGLQRVTAALKFLRNEIKVFGEYYYKDFEDNISNDIDFIININNLRTRKEVLQWYIDFNTGGTVHTDEEIERVRELLKLEE